MKTEEIESSILLTEYGGGNHMANQKGNMRENAKLSLVDKLFNPRIINSNAVNIQEVSEAGHVARVTIYRWLNELGLGNKPRMEWSREAAAEKLGDLMTYNQFNYLDAFSRKKRYDKYTDEELEQYSYRYIKRPEGRQSEKNKKKEIEPEIAEKNKKLLEAVGADAQTGLDSTASNEEVETSVATGANDKEQPANEITGELTASKGQPGKKDENQVATPARTKEPVTTDAKTPDKEVADKEKGNAESSEEEPYTVDDKPVTFGEFLSVWIKQQNQQATPAHVAMVGRAILTGEKEFNGFEEVEAMYNAVMVQKEINPYQWAFNRVYGRLNKGRKKQFMGVVNGYTKLADANERVQYVYSMYEPNKDKIDLKRLREKMPAAN